MSTAVIIPAHNAADTIADQLDALTMQRGAPPFEVIVVANRCTDGTAAVARSFADRLDLRVVVADDDASVAYARNAGVAATDAAYLLFCDADDRAAPGWVAGMVRPLAAGEADTVGGILRVDRARTPEWVYHWRYAAIDGTTLRELDGRLPYAVGASSAVTAEAYRAIGGYDERFRGVGGEDVDFSWRLLRAGYRIAPAPDAEILYRPRPTAREARRQSMNYVRGGLMLRAKEGVLGPPPPLWRVLGRSAVLAARAAARRTHPLVIAARFDQQVGAWRAHKRWVKATGASGTAR